MNKKTIGSFVLLAAIGCIGTSGTQTPYQDWLYTGTNADASQAISLNLNRDGSYELAHLLLLSPNSGDLQLETGTFVATGFADGILTFTPKEWTCPSSNPTYATRYLLDGTNLTVMFNTGTVGFVANTASTTSNFNLMFGCFANFPDGFVASPMKAAQ